MRLALVAAAVASLAALAALAALSGYPGPKAGAPAAETKDRLSEAQMEALVRGPSTLLREGRRAEADAAFRALLDAARARGPAGAVRAADLLTAWGVAVYSEGDGDESGDTRRLALPWFREAVGAARTAWGPNHPETALALQDLADAIRETSPEAPGAEAEQALREALAIRLKALGPRNGETLYNMVSLADVLSAGPAAGTTEPARADEAETLYRAAIADILSSRAVKPLEIRLGARLRLARLYARTGRTADALAEAEAARRDRTRPGRDSAVACLAYDKGFQNLSEAMEAHGARAYAQRLRDEADRGPGRCLSELRI